LIIGIFNKLTNFTYSFYNTIKGFNTPMTIMNCNIPLLSFSEYSN